MGKASPRTVVLDAGALIAFEKADGRMRALCREALRTRAKLVVPAGVLGQVWRDGSRQVALRALVTGPTTTIPPLDRVLAEASGILCGRARTSDVIDASVVLIARQEHAVVVTSDAEDLRRLDPALGIQSI
jgi:rRNA-processing protein FCF1